MAEEGEGTTGTAQLFPFHASTSEECFKQLGVSNVETHSRTGLTAAEAAERLEQFGYNKLSEKRKKTIWERIWSLVANVLVFILVVVAIVAAAQAVQFATTTPRDNEGILTNCLQIALILFVIIINVVMGIYQEGSAEAAADALKAMLSSEAVVLRDGQEMKIPADELVPGDIVRLSLGDRVPADLRMIEVINLAAQEAALTGESLPVEKSVDPIVGVADPNSQPLGDRHNMCYSATLISTGSGTGLVVTTGDQTEIGTINTLVNKVEDKKTALLQQIDIVSNYLAVFIMICALITWLIAFFQTGQDGLEALNTALVSAVAMVPAGLQAILTMTYAWAVSNMAKQNAIIRALPAVETLGSVTVICSDKTGTLTKNEMTLVAFVTKGKRWIFNVEAKERTADNFCVNEKYMATRADHTKFLKSNEIIKTGPSVDRKSRGSSFPFGITFGFGKTAHGGVEPEEPAHLVADESTPEEIMSTAFNVNAEHPDPIYLRQMLVGGILCSKCVLGENGGKQGEIGNPTELSILRAAYFGDVNVAVVKDSAPIIAEVPFSSEYKFMSTVHEPVVENDGEDYMDELIVHVKGAPDRLIPLCKYQAKCGSFAKADLEPCDTNYWVEQIAVLSSHGLRVLALTRGSIPKGSVNPGDQLKPDFIQDRPPWLTIVGLCAIMDPPRPECVRAIAEAHRAGVRVAMITGDHKDTAIAIGGALGLVNKQYSGAITGPELDEMSDAELRIVVQKYNIFSRASPQNKIKIVVALQAEGEVCGMTGDGVNDAPALKAADMGVAMGKDGTDVAREASDMILADDNFATIVSAIREGRAVWDNLRKVLFVNTPINNAQGLSVTFGLLFGLKESPLSPIQVLYCNLVCACTLGFVTATEPAEDGIMDQPPRRVGKRLIGRFLLLRIILGTVILIATTVGSVFWVKAIGYGELNDQRSQALNVLSFGAVTVTMSARFARKSAYHCRSFRGNDIANYSYIIMTVLQVIITYVPGLNDTIFSMNSMDGTQWGIVVLFALVVLIVMEAEKSLRNYLTNRKYDTDDKELDLVFDGAPKPPHQQSLPQEVDRFGKGTATR